ncbi:MAG: hypothetical protein ACYC5X_02685 [Syntrophales bacterium]
MKISVNRQRLPGLWLLLLCLTVVLACRSSQLPEQLIGKWQSDHERYKYCFMQIQSERIVFGNEEQNTGIGIIKKVTQLKRDSKQIVSIEYMDLDLTMFTVNLVHSNSADDSIWFENQPEVVWKRVSLLKALQ